MVGRHAQILVFVLAADIQQHGADVANYRQRHGAAVDPVFVLSVSSHFARNDSNVVDVYVFFRKIFPYPVGGIEFGLHTANVLAITH